MAGERIVFMGTPEFAVASLEALLEAGLNIVAVITVPDKPAGRGQQLKFSAVKEAALKHNLPLLQPEKLKNPEFLAELEALNPDLQIVVAFRMLPKEVWNLPRLGTFNLHASLLPQYRGAAPINWAIINGEKESGVTTFLLNEDIDTGDVMFQEKITLDERETAGSLHDKLMNVGSDLVVKTAQFLIKGEVKPNVQTVDNIDLKPAPKIFKEDCLIDWSQNAQSILAKIRGLSPYPAAFSVLYNGEKAENIKIFDAEVVNKSAENANVDAGFIQTDGRHYIYVSTGDGQLVSITDIQLSGKKRMQTADFLRGFSILEGAKMGK